MNRTDTRALVLTSLLASTAALAGDLHIMITGLGSGSVTVTPTTGSPVTCTSSCTYTYTQRVTLTASGAGFVGWNADHYPAPMGAPSTGTPDCTGSGTCSLDVLATSTLKVKARFERTIPPLAPGVDDADLTYRQIQDYLAANIDVDTPAEFVAALPQRYREGWLMMTRSESLQTGTAENPRLMLASPTAQTVFTFAFNQRTDPSYPAAHHAAIEMMSYDAANKNFLFHEIRVRDITEPSLAVRTRGGNENDLRCTRCHSTRNVRNPGPTAGTDGLSRNIPWKNKPNWDTYDNWGGLLAFNRDRIHRGSVEAAAFRRLLNPWEWRSNPEARAIVEQLKLQPDVPGAVTLAATDFILRLKGGANDGMPIFPFDDDYPTSFSGTEAEFNTLAPAPESVSYSFDGLVTPGPGSPVFRDQGFVRLFMPTATGTPAHVDEGRGVDMFDLLIPLNHQRIGHEIGQHQYATSDHPIDARALAMAISRGCISINPGGLSVLGATTLALDTSPTGFFTLRSGKTPAAMYLDTQSRTKRLPVRKADIQKLTVDRTGDPYVFGSTPVQGLMQRYGRFTARGVSTSPERLRQEIFQRNPGGTTDVTLELGGDSADREFHDINAPYVAAYRYFLEPLGISVDKWSMGVRGRSRTYTFADVTFQPGTIATAIWETTMGPDGRPIPGLTADTRDCTTLVTAANLMAPALPPTDQTPTFTDVQRVFNKGCIECHGGLEYPPYANHGTGIDFSEDPDLEVGPRVLTRSHERASSWARPSNPIMLELIERDGEYCPPSGGTLGTTNMMPCGGPKLSQTDIETIRRWIAGNNPDSEGDPHLKTANGVRYDFQGAGEFVLLRDEGAEVQVRNTPIQTNGPVFDPHAGISSCVSLTTAVAVKVGPHRITYQTVPSQQQSEPPRLKVDGVVISSFGAELRLPSGGRILAVPTSGIRIETLGGTVIDVTAAPFPYYGVSFMNVNVKNNRANEGLVGAVAARNWLPATSSGTLLGPRPASLDQRHKQLYDIFGNSWRVTPATSLFDYEPGTSTASYTLGWWPAKGATTCSVSGAPPQIPVKPPRPTIPFSSALQACAPIVDAARRNNCALDVSAIGDYAFVNGYRAIEVNELNRKPAASQLLEPADRSMPGSTLVNFKWKVATDPDENPVSYRFCRWSADDVFTINACDPPTASLNKTLTLPKGKPFLWKVLTEDGRGASTDSKTFWVKVKP